MGLQTPRPTDSVPIPVTQRAIFDRNVLTEVICQVRFPTILAISSNEPAVFQDLIRAEYPLYSRESAEDLPVEIREMISQLQVAGIPQRERHTFATAAGTRSIALAPDFLAVSERAYRTWEDFGPQITRALAALRDVYRPAFLTRVGLRYRDVIDKSQIPGIENAPWDQLINPILIGPLGSDPLRVDVEAQDAKVILRFDEVPGAKVRIHHGLGKMKGRDPVVYFFDADFFTSGNTEANDVDRILDSFHRASGNLFRWAISRTLSDALGPREIRAA